MKKDTVAELSAEIYDEFKSKPAFNAPHGLLESLSRAKSEVGKYPVYSGSRRKADFIRFLSSVELAGFKQFDRRPRWKKYSRSARHFRMEIADTYAGGLFPDRTPYSIDGFWTKRWGVCYSVSIFIDGGQHIDTQKVNAKRPIPLKEVLKTAVGNSLKIKGKCFDGYWY